MLIDAFRASLGFWDLRGVKPHPHRVLVGAGSKRRTGVVNHQASRGAGSLSREGERESGIVRERGEQGHG
jgi:hypothetical protein